MAEYDPTLVAVIVLLAFGPPVLYTIVIRNVERLNRNAWSALFRAFFYGAIFSVVFAIILEELFASGFVREYQRGSDAADLAGVALIVVVAAPLIEEFTKGLGVRATKRSVFELEDGIVFGAAAGLGFSATENVIYEVAAIEEHGTQAFVAVAAFRSITSSFLHATASGLVGYGLARVWLERRMLVEAFPYYALAVLLHAAFNALALTYEFQGVPLLGVLFIVLVSWAGIHWTVRRIRSLDRAPLASLEP